MPVTKNNFSRIAASTTSDALRNERLNFFGFYPQGGSNVDTVNPVNSYYMLRDIHKLWLQNPLAYRIIETQNNYVTGDGLTYKAEDKKTQELLDEFYKGKVNKWNKKLSDRIRSLSMNGELILEIDISAFAGKVGIRNRNPSLVSEIFKIRENEEDLFAIKFNNEDKKEIIRWVADKDDPNGKYVGEIFYFAVNKTSFQSRGLSDLFSYRDWLKIFDKSLYSTAKRAGLLLSFVWDIKMTGANPDQIKAKYKQILKDPPKPGSFRVHNETEEWSEETPNLQGRDITEIYKLISGEIVAGSGMPEYFYGQGGDTNLATARVMSAPFFRQIKARQKVIEMMFTDQFEYAIWLAKQTKVLNVKADETFTITMPEPDTEKANNMAKSLLQFANAVTILETNGYVGKKEVQAVIGMIFGQIGVDVEQTDEDELEEEQNKLADKIAAAMRTTRKKIA